MKKFSNIESDADLFTSGKVADHNIFYQDSATKTPKSICIFPKTTKNGRKTIATGRQRPKTTGTHFLRCCCPPPALGHFVSWPCVGQPTFLAHCHQHFLQTIDHHFRQRVFFILLTRKVGVPTIN